RTQRPFVVSPEGRAFYDACRSLLESWEKAKAGIAAVKARVDGTVRVAAIYSVGLHDVSRHMQRFMSLYPDARVQLECLHPHNVVEAVRDGEADVGIMSYPPADRALSIVPLRSEPMAFVCHPNHRLARRRVVAPADLGGETFIAFDDEYSARLDDDLRATRGALLDDTIAVLTPAEPICLAETATVHEAIQSMLSRRQAGVLITDGGGRLTGIFTERDVLTRVVGKN